MLKRIFLLFFFINACGYQPIYQNKNDVEFKDVIFLGDKKINRKIIALTKIKKNPQSVVNNQLILRSEKRIIETSKDSKGIPASYRTEVEIYLTIKVNDRITKERRFFEVFNYNNQDNKSKLSDYQSNIENNLINKIIEDLLVDINL